MKKLQLSKIRSKLETPRLAIDFGTANCVIIQKGKGIVLSEPTVVAIDPKEKKVLAVGLEAKKMLGKVPQGIYARRPLINGGIANYRLAEALLNRFFKLSLGNIRIRKPEVIVSIPAGLTSVEERALIQALKSVGAKNIFLFPEPIAASIGAQMPIHESSGNLIVNLGGGTAEIAVISLNGMVNFESHRGSGDALNKAIVQFVKENFHLAIGEQTAEELKIKVGSAINVKDQDQISMEIKGRDIRTSLPSTVVISTNDLVESMKPILIEILYTIKKVLDKTPPELISDIYDRGIVLSGGTSMLRNIDKLITNSIGVPAYVVDDPLTCVVRGLEQALEHIDDFKRSVKGN